MQATLESEINSKVSYYNDLINERIERPSPKSAYLAELNKTQSEIDELIAQNNSIIAANRAEELASVVIPTEPDFEERLAAAEDMIAAIVEGAI